MLNKVHDAASPQGSAWRDSAEYRLPFPHPVEANQTSTLVGGRTGHRSSFFCFRYCRRPRKRSMPIASMFSPFQDFRTFEEKPRTRNSQNTSTCVRGARECHGQPHLVVPCRLGRFSSKPLRFRNGEGPTRPLSCVFPERPMLDSAQWWDWDPQRLELPHMSTKSLQGRNQRL